MFPEGVSTRKRVVGGPLVDIVEVFGLSVYTAQEQVLAQSLVKRELLYKIALSGGSTGSKYSSCCCC